MTAEAEAPALATEVVPNAEVARALRLLWASTAVRALGDSMIMVSLVWVIFEATGNAGGQALYQFAYTSLIAVGSLVVGALLDRYRVVPAMVADGIGRAVAVTVVIVALAVNVAVLPAALLVAFYLGITLHFTGNGFPALVAAALEPRHHPRANMIEGLAGGIAGISGPVVAGLLIANAGAGAALGVAGFASVAGALLLAAGRRPLMAVLPPRSVGVVGWSGIVAGIRYVATRPVLLGTSVAFAGGGIFGIMANVAMPLYATQVLGGDVSAYSAMVSATSIGAIPGIIVGRAVGNRIGTGRALIGGMMLAGLLQTGLAFVHELPQAVTLVALSGFVSGSAGAWANTLRMASMDASMRGRAFGAMRAITHTPAPFAALAAAVVVPAVGIPGTFLLAGLNAVLMGVGLAAVRGIREG